MKKEIKIENENCLNKSMEMSNIILNINNSPKNNILYKLHKYNYSNKGNFSDNNSKEKNGKHNKSTYY